MQCLPPGDVLELLSLPQGFEAPSPWATAESSVPHAAASPARHGLEERRSQRGVTRGCHSSERGAVSAADYVAALDSAHVCRLLVALGRLTPVQQEPCLPVLEALVERAIHKHVLAAMSSDEHVELLCAYPYLAVVRGLRLVLEFPVHQSKTARELLVCVCVRACALLLACLCMRVRVRHRFWLHPVYFILPAPEKSLLVTRFPISPP